MKYLVDIPYTISYVIRKHQQLDSFMELPKEQRPPDTLIWDGTSEEMAEWIDKVVYKKEPQTFTLDVSEIEG